MTTKKSLGDRMKGYENIPRHYLMKRTPVIIRLDGKAFHTYTRSCKKPYDVSLHYTRSCVLEYLCTNIQGVIIGYAQSDEISLVLKDWQTYNTSAWFDNNLQKLVSVSASMCTMKWNSIASICGPLSPNAMFDSRAFNLPKEEVVNYLIWRQQDWERNSIQMLAQSFYSPKQMHGVNCAQLVTKVEQEHGVIWGNLEPWKKQGEVWLPGGLIHEGYLFKDNRTDLDNLLNTNDED